MNYKNWLGKTVVVLDGCGTKGVCQRVEFDKEDQITYLTIDGRLYSARACRLAA